MTAAWKAPIFRRGIIIPVVMIFAVINTVCCSGMDTSHDRQPGKESIGAMSNAYVRLYADARRSSCVDIAASGTGEVVWQEALHEDDTLDFAPEALLAAGGFVVAYSRDRVSGFDAAGKRLWTKIKRPGSPVSIFDGKVYFRGQDTQINEMSAITLGGDLVKERMYVLDAYMAAAPVYIEPLADGFLAMCVSRPMPEEGGPETTLYKKEYGTLDYGWVAGFSGEPRLLPLYDSNTKRFITFQPENIVVYNADPGEDIEEEEEIGRFDYPMDSPVAVSCDLDGNLYFLGTKDGQSALIVVDGSGKELWSWTQDIHAGSVGAAQPPVLGPDKLVYVGSGRKVMTLAEGKLVRTFETDGEMVSYTTALADGALLVAAEKALYMVGGEGQTVFSLEFDERIVAPPVVGKDGGIYVATSKTLTRID